MEMTELADLDRLLNGPEFRSSTLRSKQLDFLYLGVDILNSEETTTTDDGVVHFLVKALHNELILWRRDGQTRYRPYLEPSDTLFVALVCSALEKNLQQCPESKLEDLLIVVKDDLVPALRAVMLRFIPWWSCDSTIRNHVLSNTARIISHVTNYIDAGHEELFDALIPVLQCQVAPDIRVDAACAIASLLYYIEKGVHIVGEVESLMISTLTTAVLSVADDRLEEIVWALTYLVAFVPTTRTKIAKRRCSILAINKLMGHANLSIRRHALDLSRCILGSVDSVVNGIGNKNMDLVLEELFRRSSSETDAELQVLIVKNIEQFIKQKSLRTVYFTRAMEAFKSIAFSDDANSAASKAALIYINATRAPECSLSVLQSVFEFTMLPLAEVRKEALVILSLAMQETRIATSLLAHPSTFENLVLLIRYGCGQDCTRATALIAQLAEDELHHMTLCSNMPLLEAMIDLVKSNSHRSAQSHALDAILSLLSNPATTSSFLAYPGLLPYLITLVNATTADDVFKHKLLAAIMTMSKAILA